MPAPTFPPGALQPAEGLRLGWGPEVLLAATRLGPPSHQKPTPARPRRSPPSGSVLPRFCASTVRAVHGWMRPDEQTRTRVMAANGSACFREWIASQDRTIAPVAFDWAAKVKERPSGDSLRVEGNVIYFEYTGSAENRQRLAGSRLTVPDRGIQAGGALAHLRPVLGRGTSRSRSRSGSGRAVAVELLDSDHYRCRRCLSSRSRLHRRGAGRDWQAEGR